MVIFWRFMAVIWFIEMALYAYLNRHTVEALISAALVAIFAVGAEILEAIKKKGD